MENKLGGLPLAILTALLAVPGFALRLLAQNAALIVCTLAALILFFVLSRLFWRERDHARLFGGKHLADLILSLSGAALLLAGCFSSAASGSGAGRYIAIFGAISALALVRAAALRWKGETPSAAWFVPVILYYFATLFYDYRRWMHDPEILDYCFLLFALLCFLFAFYHFGAFSFQRGNRRSLLFFSMAGVYFGAVSLAGLDTAQALVFAGGALSLLGVLWQASVIKEPDGEAAPGSQEAAQ